MQHLLLNRPRRNRRRHLSLLLLLSRLLDRDKSLHPVSLPIFFTQRGLTSPINFNPVARRSLVRGWTSLSFNTSSHTLRITLSTSNFAPFPEDSAFPVVCRGLVGRTFQITRTPCSEACSSSFRTCSAERPDCSASWSFWKTVLSSSAGDGCQLSTVFAHGGLTGT
jgi:hypothetical protein